MLLMHEETISFGLTLEEPTPISTQQVQYDSVEKGSDKWYHWYNQGDTPEERRLVLKRDLLILIRPRFENALISAAFLGYWVKGYICLTNRLYRALFTQAQYKVKDVHALYTLRHFVGAFGSPYFSTMQYILGSWYRRIEGVPKKCTSLWASPCEKELAQTRRG
ncbi:hypothetical protein IW262DRAFT_1289977 [Armillaria fumosa]|nr:hypothetical protein IW262DRAFT_1289977 [Armillaria fumosa]